MNVELFLEADNLVLKMPDLSFIVYKRAAWRCLSRCFSNFGHISCDITSLEVSMVVRGVLVHQQPFQLPNLILLCLKFFILLFDPLLMLLLHFYQLIAIISP